MSAAADDVDGALLAAVQLSPRDDVLVLGGGSLVLAARELVGDGWVYAVRAEVDELEELLAEAHAADVSGVAYLVGEPHVLPLPDGSVAAAVGRVVADEDLLAAVAAELARVLSAGGRVALAEPEGRAAAASEALARAGFETVEPAGSGDELVVAGRRR